MKRELTEEDIRANLKKEYAIKPGRVGMAAILGGIAVSLLCFTMGRLLEMLLGVIFIFLGIFEKIKSQRIKSKIDKEKIIIKEGQCIEKRMRMRSDGQRRYFYFTKDDYYIASKQDMKLWEKTKIGDKFYLVYLGNQKKIKKIYPQNILKYVKD